MTDNLFLHELRLRFERFIEIKEKLDTKANTIIATSGTIATLFMGFGIFLLRDVNTDGLFFIPAIITLLAEIVLTIITIRYAINAYKLTGYYYPLEVDQFFKDDELNEPLLQKMLDYTPEKLLKPFAKSYWYCIHDNEDVNKLKVKDIQKSQNLLLVAVSLIPLFAFLVILAKFVV